MPESRSKKTPGCGEGNMPGGMPCCCQVDAVVAVDGRGQLVLPKEVREKAGIKAGDLIISVNGSPVSRWEDFAKTIAESALVIGPYRHFIKLRFPNAPTQAGGSESIATGAIQGHRSAVIGK